MSCTLSVNSQLIFCLGFLLLIKFQIFFQTVNCLFTMETVAMGKNQHFANLFKYKKTKYSNCNF